MKYRNSKWRF